MLAVYFSRTLYSCVIVICDVFIVPFKTTLTLLAGNSVNEPRSKGSRVLWFCFSRPSLNIADCIVVYIKYPGVKSYPTAGRPVLERMPNWNCPDHPSHVIRIQNRVARPSSNGYLVYTEGRTYVLHPCFITSNCVLVVADYYVIFFFIKIKLHFVSCVVCW